MRAVASREMPAQDSKGAVLVICFIFQVKLWLEVRGRFFIPETLSTWKQTKGLKIISIGLVSQV